MTKTTNWSAGDNSASESQIIITGGEILPNGALIEPVAASKFANLQLLYWNGKGKPHIKPEIAYSGRLYRPADLDLSFRRAMLFPSAAVDYDEPKMLLKRVVELLQQYSGLDEVMARLLALWVVSTWFSDCLANPPVLLISSIDTRHAMNLLRVLRCLSRHAVMLGDISRGSLLRTMPMAFRPTLLLNVRDLLPRTIALLCNSNHRNVMLPGNQGRVLDVVCSKAVFVGMNGSTQNWGDQIIRVHLPPAQPDVQTVDDHEQEKIASEFQPGLLMYRLHRLTPMRESASGRAAFARLKPATDLLSCIPDDSEVAQAVALLLQSQEQDRAERRSRDLNSAIIEVLWIEVHDSAADIAVCEIAELANALLRNRGETREYTAVEVGCRLRKLNIPRHKGASFNSVQFSLDVSKRVHRLAREWGLKLPLHVESCADCAGSQTISE